jgi:hypothetical protein
VYIQLHSPWPGSRAQVPGRFDLFAGDVGQPASRLRPPGTVLGAQATSTVANPYRNRVLGPGGILGGLNRECRSARTSRGARGSAQTPPAGRAAQPLCAKRPNTFSVVLQTRQSDHDHPTGRPIYATPRKVKQRNPMVNVGLYPIVTFQYSSTTLSQFSYHIQ